MLFSATFPKQIEKLAKSVLQHPLEIVVGERSTVNKDITQIVEVHEEEDKFMRLLQLLGIWNERGSVLIFVDKQEKCDQLFQDLLRSGYPALSLHGGKDQLDRDHTLHEFKTLVKSVMVATSVAGRGLDVPEIVVVVNYNCPNHMEDYVHRVGRTGRAGRKGTAYTFISPDEEQFAHIMIKTLKKAGEQAPPELVEMSTRFNEKVARGEAKWVGSGFVGKGFTFDGDEMNETQKMASLQRKAYDLEQGILPERDDDVGVMGDDEYAGDDEEGGGSSASAAAALFAASSASAGAPLDAAKLAAMSPLDRAKATAASLFANKASSGAQPPPPPGPPPGPIDAKAAMARVKLIAQQMSASKGTGGGIDAETGKEVPMHFAEELEINDYPIQARRKVTQRSALDELTDRTGVAIISRGSFVPPGKVLAPGERKLYLLIEGSNDMQVKFAKLEVIKALEEETVRLGASTPGLSAAYGRYAII